MLLIEAQPVRPIMPAAKIRASMKADFRFCFMLLFPHLHPTPKPAMPQANDSQNPQQGKTFARSLEKIATLRAVMEMKLAQIQQRTGSESAAEPPPLDG